MDLLREFIQLELEEGKKLPAALAISTALMSPFAMDNAEKKQTQKLAQMSRDTVNRPVDSVEELPKKELEKKKKASVIDDYEVSSYSKAEMKEFVRDAADVAGISAAFLDGIITQESRYNQRATSHKNAMGVAQFIRSTADEMGLENPYNARDAIYASAKYLKKLLDLNGGDYVLAAASYNAGFKNVSKYGGVPPFEETQKYVKEVMKFAKLSEYYEDEFDSGLSTKTSSTSSSTPSLSSVTSSTSPARTSTTATSTKS